MEQLRPMQLPDPVSWWPMAPGWWFLLVLFIASVIGMFWWFRRRWTDPRRYALSELKNLQKCYFPQENSQQPADQTALIVHCNQLLKRTALTLYPRHNVASLSGDAWINFLLNNSTGCKAEALQCLKDGAYRQRVKYDSAELLEGCRQWVKTAGKGGTNNV